MLATFRHPPQSRTPASSNRRRTVLVTGASGRIGSRFAEAASARYDLKLMVKDPKTDAARKLSKYGSLIQAELQELEMLKDLCQGVDTVVHLAADPSPRATWESIQQNNITGTYNLFTAARAAGCRRVVLASSIHAVSGYPAEMQVKTHEPVCPGDLYGVSKCFGEALGRYMAEREELSCIAIRIGGFQPRDVIRAKDSGDGLDFWVSPRDLVQLIERCIDNETLRFGVFHGISDNAFKRLDISDAREMLGYAPQDDAFSEHPDVPDWDLPDNSAETRPVAPEKSGLREDL